LGFRPGKDKKNEKDFYLDEVFNDWNRYQEQVVNYLLIKKRSFSFLLDIILLNFAGFA
jgi:hypothetical protein